jgi:hypothetical protein
MAIKLRGKTHEKTDAVLREACGQYYDRRRSNDGAYHAEQGFAQRRAETWLIDDRRGSAAPCGLSRSSQNTT